MVKYVKDNTGRFYERPHFAAEELDRECEAIVNRLLLSRRGEITFPISTCDLTVLIEKHADLDLYADLAQEYGPEVEGVTEFVPKRLPFVRISQHLDDERYSNRLRTTLSHEFGHVKFHGPLWRLQYQNPDSPLSSNFLVCKRPSLLRPNQIDWMEWQAGYVSGAILMPATDVRDYVRDIFKTGSPAIAVNVGDSAAAELIGRVAVRYQVSRDAARVRLSVLNLLSENSNRAYSSKKFIK